MPDLRPGRLQGIGQQAGDRHRADAARNPRNVTRDVFYFLEIHITGQADFAVGLLMPTSITTAPGLIQSPFTRFG